MTVCVSWDWEGFVIRSGYNSYLSGHSSATFAEWITTWCRASVQVRGDSNNYGLVDFGGSSLPLNLALMRVFPRFLRLK